MEDKLKKYGLKILHAESEDREPIDFSIADNEDNVAWVWGSEPWNDIQIECVHPHQCIDFGDGEEQGECELCGAYCNYHYEEDDQGNKTPEAHEWSSRRKPSGLIGKYIEQLQEKW